MMPGMDGFQVMEGLKQIEIDGYLPVLVITAQPGHMLRALKAGAKDFITKPINLAEVLTRVYNMLEVRLLHIETKNNSRVLEQTVERLKEVERLKDGFLSTASHELRTPLTSIRGSLGLLASGVVGALSDEAVEVVAIAERNAVRLMALINDILDLERLETGTIELRFAQVSGRVDPSPRDGVLARVRASARHHRRGARGLFHDLGRRRSDRPGRRQSPVERREVLAARRGGDDRRRAAGRLGRIPNHRSRPRRARGPPPRDFRTIPAGRDRPTRARREAPAWGWPSASRSSSSMAARSASRARKEAAAPSGSASGRRPRSSRARTRVQK